MTEPTIYRDIHPDSFIHPRDRAALETLRAVPLLDRAVEKVSSGTIEGVVHAEHHQTSVRVGPTQYPSIYRFVERACTILDVPVPDTYLDSGYTINASAFGMKRCAITLYSGLIDQLDDDEILSVVGHEVGHIACDHMKYKTLAAVIHFAGYVALDQIPVVGGLFNVGMQQALGAWGRAAEFSCDRAALLVTEDPEVVATTLARLAGTCRRFRDEFNLDAALEQADDYKAQTGAFAKWVEASRKTSATHPDPIARAQEIMEWASSAQYQRIVDGDYLTRSAVATQSDSPFPPCPSCGKPVPADHVKCWDCGLRLDPAFHIRCPHPQTPHVCDVDWKFCPECRLPLRNHSE